MRMVRTPLRTPRPALHTLHEPYSSSRTRARRLFSPPLQPPPLSRQFSLPIPLPFPPLCPQVKAYNQSATTLNLIRAFATGGYSDLQRIHAWNLDFTESTPEGAIYHDIASRIGDCLKFLQACGVDVAGEQSQFRSTSFYTSHEALLLEYEEALTREDSTTGLWYGCSAHYLWLGERTRQLDGAHIEYLRGINNPLGVKISDKADPAEVVRLCDTLNPNNEPGRITLVCRMGAKNLYEKYPNIVRQVARSGHKVVWQSDPMHGNTFKAESGFKTRAVDKIRDELIAFFDVHEAEGTHPGGIHLEMTGKDVTECVGGLQNIQSAQLGDRYHTHCDPRLNASQSLEIAFLVADRMRRKAGKAPLLTSNLHQAQVGGGGA